MENIFLSLIVNTYIYFSLLAIVFYSILFATNRFSQSVFTEEELLYI